MKVVGHNVISKKFIKFIKFIKLYEFIKHDRLYYFRVMIFLARRFIRRYKFSISNFAIFNQI